MAALIEMYHLLLLLEELPHNFQLMVMEQEVMVIVMEVLGTQELEEVAQVELLMVHQAQAIMGCLIV